MDRYLATVCSKLLDRWPRLTKGDLDLIDPSDEEQVGELLVTLYQVPREEAVESVKGILDSANETRDRTM